MAAAEEDLLPLQQALEPVVVLPVDDADEVFVVEGVPTQHPHELLFQLCHQLVLHPPVHQAVVRGHAGLAGV